MRDVAIQIAVRVGLQAQQDGVAPQIMSAQELRERVQQRFWIPQYLSYELIRKEENISN
jgi:malic enzyme